MDKPRYRTKLTCRWTQSLYGHNRYNICQTHNIEIPDDKIIVLGNEKYKTKDDVILYMLNFQMGRRNLGIEVRYKIVQKYKPLLISKAKENLSNAGKGLTTLTKVNVRKTLADMAGCSEGQYHKLEKIYQSDNEEVKQKIDNKEMSVNAGYKDVTDRQKDTVDNDIRQAPKKHVEENNISHAQSSTEKFDNEITTIDAQIEQLYEEKESLIRDRFEAFRKYNQDLTCEYIRIDGYMGYEYKIFLVRGNNRVFFTQHNSSYWDQTTEELFESIDLNITTFEIKQQTTLSKDEKAVITEKIFSIKNTVLQDSEDRSRQNNNDWSKLLNQSILQYRYTEKQKEWISDIYKIACKEFHPDINKSEDATEAMQFINKLFKESLGA